MRETAQQSAEAIAAFLGRITPGSWPDWVAALGTSAAFLIAAISYRRSRADAHAAPARLVYSRYNSDRLTPDQPADVTEGYAEPGVIVPIPPDESAGYKLATHAIVVKVTVHNNSNEVTSNVNVHLLADVDDFPNLAEYTIAALAPGEKYLVDFVAKDRWQSQEGIQGVNFEVRLTFTDSAGNHWSRVDARPVREQKGNPHTPIFGPGLISVTFIHEDA